ncbi:hypothetical protein VTI74DRAFT_2970 [Chaetomium olivicolor]
MVFLPVNTLLLALSSPLANLGVATPHPSSLTLRSTSPIANGIPLRILPLGASITYGVGSSTGNGYRGPLRDQLTAAGNPVNMVGSRQAGTMRDNDVEGWPGLRIEQVYAKAVLGGSVVAWWKPNVVLINAGTNDAAQGWNVSSAGERMETMVRGVWEASPRAVVVLSTLLVNKRDRSEGNVKLVNREFRELAKRLREAEGRRLVMVDMHSPDGPGLGDLVDGTHPGDMGYRKMANLWFKGLVAAADAGWLEAPEEVPGVPDDGAA